MKHLLSILFSLISVSIFAQNWQQIGPEGGYFKDIQIHPLNPNIVYVGSDDGGGIWKSQDAGDTWALLTVDFPNMTGWKVVLDENDLSTIYACDLYGRYGILKSDDAGQTWSEANIGLVSVYDKMVSGLVVKSSDTLFVSTGESTTSTPVRPGNGMYRSYDAGNSWEQAGLQGITIPSSGKNAFGTIFAGTEDHGLYFTNDNGQNWSVHPNIPTVGTVFEIETASNVVMVASSEGIFLSTDWGINFTSVGLAGEFNFDACIHKVTPHIELFSSTMTGLKYYSSLTGNWTTIAGSYFLDQIIIGIDSDGNNIYCSGFSNSPMVKSIDDGNTWSALNSSPIATELTDIYLDPMDNDHMIACLMGSYNLNGDFDREAVYETTDGGANWMRKGPDAHGLCLTVNPSNTQEAYLGTFAQGVVKTTNGFNTFTQLSANGVSVVDVIVSPIDPNLVLISEIDWSGPTVSVKRSTDGGSNFTMVSNSVANRMVFHPTNTDSIYVATNDGVYLSVDNGQTFNSWQLSGEDCRSIAVKGNSVYTGTTDGKVFHVTPSGAVDISGGWTSPVEIKSILVTENDLFVGMNGAEKDTFMVLQGSIWRSSDNGLNWSNITSDMSATNIYGNNIIETNGDELYVGTYGGGIFLSSGLNLSANIPEFDMAADFFLFPNPASDQIEVYHNLKGDVEFRVFNPEGKNVTSATSLLSDFQDSLSLDVTGLKEGIYVLELDNHEGVYRLKFLKSE